MGGETENAHQFIRSLIDLLLSTNQNIPLIKAYVSRLWYLTKARWRTTMAFWRCLVAARSRFMVIVWSCPGLSRSSLCVSSVWIVILCFHSFSLFLLSLCITQCIHSFFVISLCPSTCSYHFCIILLYPSTYPLSLSVWCLFPCDYMNGCDSQNKNAVHRARAGQLWQPAPGTIKSTPTQILVETSWFWFDSTQNYFLYRTD